VEHVIGSEEDAFLRANRRAFLLGLRADGSPTGWPMIGIYNGEAMEFSTYARSQKVRDFQRHPMAGCLVAPAGGDRALMLRGTVEVLAGHPDGSMEAEVLAGVNVDRDIAETARARAATGKRVTLRLTPQEARFITGFSAPDADGI
jgi:hypothetical protein